MKQSGRKGRKRILEGKEKVEKKTRRKWTTAEIGVIPQILEHTPMYSTELPAQWQY